MEVKELFLKEREKKSKYKIVKRLGKGSFGETFLVESRDNKLYVLKKMSLETMEKNNMFNELDILKQMAEDGCKNGILCYKEYFFDFSDCSFYIVTEEFEDAIDMFEFVDLYANDIGINDILSIIYKISKSLKYIHDKNIGHNDIKLENILINPVSLETMIIDFGLSCNKNLCEWGGTYRYMAPEILEHRVKTSRSLIDIEMIKRADVFSLGVAFYLIINMNFPYRLMDSNNNNLDDVVVEDKNKVENFLNFWKRKIALKEYYKSLYDYSDNKMIYDKLNDIIKNMLEYDYNKRYDINDVINEIQKLIQSNVDVKITETEFELQITPMKQNVNKTDLESQNSDDTAISKLTQSYSNYSI